MRDEVTWVKIYRRLLTNDMLSRDNDAFNMFVKILLSCDRDTGTFKCGRKSLANLCNITERRVYNKLDLLKKYGFITVKSNKHYSDITVLNWEKYQAKISENRGKPMVIHQESKSNQSGIQPPPLNSTESGIQQETNGLPTGANQTLNNNKEERNINITPLQEEVGSNLIDKDRDLKLELDQLMKIVNPREKATAGRLTLLRGRKKDKYSFDEIKNAAIEFSYSKWHKENNQMTIDNLLRPSKFGNWYQKSISKKQSYTIPGSSAKKTNMPVEEELTPSQKERGSLIRKLLDKNYGLKNMTNLKEKTNEEIKEILAKL